MPRRREPLGPPAHWVRGRYLTGTLIEGAPVGVAEMRELAVCLRQRARSWRGGLVALAAQAEVPRSTIYGILAGERFMDVVTLARLERLLGPLWPGPLVDGP